MARKPLAGTVVANVLAHGTGAINVDGCRIGMSDADRENFAKGREAWARRDERADQGVKVASVYGTYGPTEVATAHDAGRWPINVLFDEDAAALLDAQAGDDVSRFFYVAKPSAAERNAGLDRFEEQGVHRYGAGIGEGHDPDAPSVERNVHPTVKPVDLMRWLCRLVTPPGGTVLDPFTGSGTTGCAAALEGFDFIGAELTPEYADIAEARIAWWERHAGEGQVGDLLAAAKAREATEVDGGQVSIFDLLNA